MECKEKPLHSGCAGHETTDTFQGRDRQNGTYEEDLMVITIV